MRDMIKQSFRDFIFSTNTDGSGKAASYVRALDMLGPILTRHYPRPVVNGSMWHEFPLADLEAIHKLICVEIRKGKASVMLADFESQRYWEKNFCGRARFGVTPLAYTAVLGDGDLLWTV